MGMVWRAENVLVRREVAIKFLLEAYVGHEATLARFRQEATAAGRIRSPHICDVLDFGHGALGPYIVMESMHGRSLAALLEQVGRIEPWLAALVVRQALVGLAAAHAAGIVHRDLKPENLFLHEPSPGRVLVKLLDFGISKFVEGSGGGGTRQGALMGTPAYMSPEQIEGAASVDARTDVWAMGVILYRSLSGREPFEGPTLPATLTRIATAEPTPLTALAPGVPAALAQVVHACLTKDRRARVASAQALADLLAPFERAPEPGELRDTLVPSRSVGREAPEASNASPSPSTPTAATALAAAASDSTWGGGPAHVAEESWTLHGSTHAVVEVQRHSQAHADAPRRWWPAVLLAVAVGAGVAFVRMGGGTPAPATGAVPQASSSSSGAPASPPTTSTTSTASTTGAPPTETSSTRATTGAPVTPEPGTTTGAAPVPGTSTTGPSSGPSPGTTGGDKPPTTSGGGGSHPRPRPIIDLTKVQLVAGLYLPLEEAPRATFLRASARCGDLAATRYGGLRGWRLPAGSELEAVAAKLPRTLFWTSRREGASAVAKNLNGGGEKTLDADKALARALCVAPRR
jgi:serine/threonine-protein kinase